MIRCDDIMQDLTAKPFSCLKESSTSAKPFHQALCLGCEIEKPGVGRLRLQKCLVGHLQGLGQAFCHYLSNGANITFHLRYM